MYSYEVTAIFSFLGACEYPQNFNRGVELQNIKENILQEWFLTDFHPKNRPGKLKIISRPKM